jgi:hypothetical protein
MKRINMISILAMMLAVFGASAQTYQEDAQIIQSIYGKAKKEVMADFVTVSPEQEKAFWELYDAYEAERKELGIKRISNVDNYIQSYGQADPSAASKAVKDAMEVGLLFDKLIQKYHGKVEKQTGPVAAAQFFHLETLFLSEVRVEILKKIPAIDALRN